MYDWLQIRYLYIYRIPIKINPFNATAVHATTLHRIIRKIITTMIMSMNLTALSFQ